MLSKCIYCANVHQPKLSVIKAEGLLKEKKKKQVCLPGSMAEQTRLGF